MKQLTGRFAAQGTDGRRLTVLAYARPLAVTAFDPSSGVVMLSDGSRWHSSCMASRAVRISSRTGSAISRRLRRGRHVICSACRF